ncbi:MAG: 3-dehydroquinate synthase [Anaerolineae bacterium]|nr:3-dehydroquinate synthase [Anaerolineae bacterium]
MAERIAVTTPEGSYDIVIEPGLLAQTDRLITEFGLGGRVAVTTNPTIGPLHGARLAASLPDAALVMIPDGEAYKTLATVSQLYTDFVGARLDRSSTVLALGGGVVGDTAGFAAATYMRGVRLVQVPTSLLSMVDSSVGGKVGVDLPEGKNLVGAFKQPDVVLIDPTVLQSLPAQEWRNGMAEILKHGLLADPLLLEPVLHQPQRAAELVRRAVQVKVDVVEQDPYEQGVRAHLNLGHTFAHAVEQVTHYQWPHGEAVGFGLLAAAQLSYALALCDSDLPEMVEDLLVVTGLPRRLNGLDAEAIYAAMATDKKWKNGRSRFILMGGVGQPRIVEDVPRSAVMDVLRQLQ